MKVILTENVKSLGNVGDIVNVSAGHARNFLVPRNLAKLADESNKKQIEDYNKMLARKVAEEKKAAEELAKKIAGLKLNFVKKVGGNGKLFGTLTTQEISNELAKQDIIVEKRLLHVTTPIKTIGTFEVEAKLFKGVETTFNVIVEMTPEQAEEMKKKQEAALKKAQEKKENPTSEAEQNLEASAVESTSEEEA